MTQIKTLRRSALQGECENMKHPLIKERIQKSEAGFSGIFVVFSFDFPFPSPRASYFQVFKENVPLISPGLSLSTAERLAQAGTHPRKLLNHKLRSASDCSRNPGRSCRVT